MIRIAKYRSGEEKEIYELIKKVFDEFVAPDYCEAGNKFFNDWIQPSKIAERQHNNRNIWLAFDDKELAGMIEIRDNTYISLLFVDKKYHGRGIAKKLFQDALKEVISRVPDLEKFYVHASPFSIPVYRKMGFVETDVMQEANGIKYMPMEMTLTVKKNTNWTE
jgi:GNAT superfamily N-acetyltransferase